MAIAKQTSVMRWLLAGASLALVLMIVLLLTRLPEPAPDDVVLHPRPGSTSTAVGRTPGTDARTTSAVVDPVDPASTTRGVPAPGDGYEVYGVVRSRSGTALAGARVRVRMEGPGIARDLGSIDSAVDGRYRIALADLATLEDSLRGVTRIFVSASAAGYREVEAPRSIAVRTTDAPDAPVAMAIECDFALLEGNRLRGRIIDAAGAPVAHAEVKLWIDASDTDDGERFACDEQRTSASGVFVLGFTSSGNYELSAREAGQGTAYVDDLVLEAARDRDLGDIRLQGGGSLAGTLRYPDRSPVRGFELWVIPESLADEANALAAATRRGAEAERGDGLFYGRATTDHEGSFRFDGLKPGSYVVRVAKGRAVVEPHQARYATGASDIALRLDAHRLVVRVENRFGAPIPGAVVACSELSPLEDGTLEPTNTMHATARGREALASFDVEPDVPLGLSASAPGSQTAEEVVILPHGTHELERELVLRPIGPTGRVRLILPRAGGSPSQVYVALESAVTRRPLVGVGVLEADEDGWLPPLAPGRYWVEVGFPSRPGAAAHFFPWRSSEPVDVRSDSEQDLVVDPRPGVRLELDLSIRGAAPADFVREDHERDGARQGVDDPFLIHHGARVRVTRADGSAEEPLQFQIPSGAELDAFEVSSRMLPGTRACSETLLELGSYRLRVEAQGFRTVEREIELARPGVETIEIALVRE